MRTEHITVCLITVRHSDRLNLTKMYGCIGIIWRGNFKGVDVRTGTRVRIIGFAGELVDKKGELGGVYKVYLWGHIRLTGVEVII